jgi:hypothetical protein
MIKPTILKRDNDFIQAFEDWKLSEKKTALRQLKELYISGFYGNSNHPDFEVERTKTYSVVLFRPYKYFNETICKFLLDDFKERIVKLGYLLYMSDHKEKVLSEYNTQFIERHYLKPDTIEDARNGVPMNRRFGNITLELFLINQHPDTFKLLLTHYIERESVKEKSIDELLGILF